VEEERIQVAWGEIESVQVDGGRKGGGDFVKSRERSIREQKGIKKVTRRVNLGERRKQDCMRIR